MSRLFFDTNLFIYLVEDREPWAQTVTGILERMSERKDVLLTSTMTLGEVLVKPLSLGDNGWANRYESLLSSPGVTLIPFDKQCARIYAQLRQDKLIKAPDAIQLACAATAGCELFITNDDRLSRKQVPGIQFIVPLDRAYL